MSAGVTAEPRQFTARMRFFHWLTAAMVLTMLCIGVAMVASLAGYHRLFSIHRPLGILLLIVVVIRFINRHYSTLPPFPATMSLRERSVASASELFLYTLLVVQPLVGWGMLSAARYPVMLYGAIHLFPILPHNVMLYAVLRKAHTVLAYLLFLTILSHLGAILFHTWVVRDGIFSRMAPWRVRASDRLQGSAFMSSNRIVLITGAHGGLGSFVTEAFLAAGDTVVGTSKSIQATSFLNPRFVAITSDLTDAVSAGQLVEAVMQRFQRIDTLAHLMGGFSGGKPIAETDDATWERMMSLNLRSAFNIFRAVIPHMRQAGRGRIVAIAARAAAEPAPNIAAYGASKAALVSLVRSAALENKDAGITVNAILPGTMNTDGNRKAEPSADFSRWVPPQDVAELVLFLAADSAAHITGSAIPVYGREA